MKILVYLQKRSPAHYKQKKVDTQIIPITEDNVDQISLIQADCIFNLIEWTGLDLPLSERAMTYLESLPIPFTGASKQNYVLTCDKIKMKKKFDAEGLPTARWQAFISGNETIRDDFTYPLIIKPSLDHCSIGLTKNSIAKHPEDLPEKIKYYLSAFKQPLLVEEFISGAEYHVPLVQKGSETIMLPPCEIVYTSKNTDAFLTYESRWNEQHPEFKASKAICTPISTQRETRLRQLSTKTFYALGFYDYARLDIRLSGDTPYILEANSNPGLDDDPEYEMAVSYRAAGMTFEDLIWSIVQSCLNRWN